MIGFDRAFSLVVGEEGGYVNDPLDPGGETKYGISKRAHPSEDIKSLTLERAKEIYLTSYWAPMGCDNLPWPMALCVFDCAVNQGVNAARYLLTKASTPVEFQAERALRYARLPTFDRFGRGWMRRLFRIYDEATR